MKSQFDLQVAVLVDQAQLLGFSAHRDVLTITSRFEAEGEKFLTITLPRFSKDLERSIENGSIPSDAFTGFRRRGKGDCRPQFLGDLLGRIFESDGTLIDRPDFKAIRAVRQICLLHSKLKELCSDEQIHAAYEAFVQTDSHIGQEIASTVDFHQFAEISHLLWGRAVGKVSAEIMAGNLIPRHGPGATADKLSSNGKYRDLSWSERLERIFPALEYVLPGYSFFEHLDDAPLYSPGQEPPVRMTAVPKTMEKPRLIAMEPSYMQKMQQGVLRILEREIGEHPFIGWLDQDRNRSLAKFGSVTRSLSTLDLSEASDRVSLRLVKSLLRFNPYFMDVVLACRSTRAKLPSGDIIHLKKFASMGSALTFPIESMVFWTIVVMAACQDRGEYLPSWKTLQSLEGRASVYGDDIIVPIHLNQPVINLLEAFGLKVNVQKSFSKSSFRESCGAEYYDGREVSVVRARKRVPHNRRHVDELVSFVEFRNLYAQAYGPTELVTDLDRHIEGIIPFPVGYRDTPALVRWSSWETPDPSTLSMNPWTHKPFIRAIAAVYRQPDDPLDDYGALMKALTTSFQEDPRHLQRAGRPVSARLKHGRYPLN